MSRQTKRTLTHLILILVHGAIAFVVYKIFGFQICVIWFLVDITASLDVEVLEKKDEEKHE